MPIVQNPLGYHTLWVCLYYSDSCGDAYICLSQFQIFKVTMWRFKMSHCWQLPVVGKKRTPANEIHSDKTWAMRQKEKEIKISTQRKNRHYVTVGVHVRVCVEPLTGSAAYQALFIINRAFCVNRSRPPAHVTDRRDEIAPKTKNS